MEDGNRLELLTGGEETMEAMMEAARNARERLWLETFILMPDKIGGEILDRVEAAARRGVDVIVVADQVISGIFSLGRYRALEEAGARVVLYNPLPPWRRLGRRVGSILNRDHRKILIADETAFCGGHNISKQYIGPEERPYYDITVRVEGPCVRDLAEVFAQTLAQSGKARPAPMPRPAPYPDGVPAAVYMMDRRHGITDANPVLRDLLRAARRRCFLTISYFVPEPWLVDEMLATAARGVDVRLMTAGKTDLPPARQAGRHLYERLLQGGVRIFEMQRQRLHAKAFVADGEHVIVGSFDYNRASAKYSLEVVVAALDQSLGSELEQTFEDNMRRSREIRLKAWRKRGPLARAMQWGFFKAFERTSGPRDGRVKREDLAGAVFPKPSEDGQASEFKQPAEA